MLRFGSLFFGISLLACASSTGGPPGSAADGGPAADAGVDGGGSGPCTNVGDCAPGTGCLRGTCVPTSRYACSGSDTPIVSVQPGNLDFGAVQVGNTINRTLSVRNLGPCNLSVTEVSLA